MSKAKKKSNKKSRSIKLTPLEKEKRAHRAEVRSIFLKSGFVRISGISDKEFEFEGRKTDFDDVFKFENILLFLEYTVTKTSNISDHLLPKKIIYDHILNKQTDFLDFLDLKFETFKTEKGDFYANAEYKIFIVYCSKNEISLEHKNQVKKIVFFDYYIAKYFKSITSVIKSSSRFEIFKFLRIKYDDISHSTILSSNYKGSLLPESYSNYDKGYKIVSFYIDPKALIEKSFVLRKYGWEDDHSLYQRMIMPSKIKQIRKYLATEERVFINNIIITLPSSTKLVDSKKNTVDPSTISKTQPVEIQVPNDFNVIGLIDGQHRVFAYHEGGEFEEKIKRLREKQNLLVTGIIYPDSISDIDRTKFEAKLFLEINSNQSNAKSDLKQAIGLILKPFSPESISRAVLEKLNQKGALERLFELNYFDKGKIKTTSIVSYGLKPLVKLSGVDSLFHLWKEENKETLKKEKNDKLLEAYITFAAEQIDNFLVAGRIQLPGLWGMTNKENSHRILNTTTVNAFLICLRKLIENKKTGSLEFYKKKLINLKSIDFLKFKSSQYGDLGELIYQSVISPK